MTNYTVDTTTIFEYRWDETHKYPLVKVLGYTVNPVVVTNTVNRDAKNGFTNRLSTLSRPPPKGGFCLARRPYPHFFGGRRAKQIVNPVHNFLTEKTRSAQTGKMPKSHKNFCAKRRTVQKPLDKIGIL